MQSFNNLKVVVKILLLVGLLSAFMGGVGYIGYNGVETINQDSDEQDVAAHEVDLGNGILQNAITLDSMANDVAASPTPDKIKEDKETVEKSRKDFEDSIADLRKSGDERQIKLIDETERTYKAYLPFLDRVFNAAESVARDGDRQKVVDAMVTSEDVGRKFQAAAQAYIDYTLANEKEVSAGATKSYETATRTIFITIIAAILISSTIGYLVAVYSISKPLRNTVNVLQSLIAGNLDVMIEGADRKDEVGDVCRAAQTFKDVLVKNRAMAEAEKLELVKKEERAKKVQALINGFDATATTTVSTVASASTQLSQTAESMSKIANDTNRQSVEVASASEQASHNVQTVAAAAEEMSATVQEISRQIAMSNGIVRDAMDKADAADKSSKELVEMSKSVGDIATLIENIAGQINLLALNATIESARSGEAGKGFAVVANEVKNLATQTAKATEQIRQQLEAVQTTASGVAGSLGEVREAIARVNEGSGAIAAAVEEQSAATKEIVSNMSTATQGVEQINGGIFSIKSGTDSTTNATKHVLDAAKMLSTQAEKMDKEVKTFLHDILAA